VRLPDFVVIGAKKAGSTWLDQMLRSHPGVSLPAARKEVAFFDLFHERGLAWYARFFKDVPPGALAGESTPEYLHHPLAPGRIETDLPKARLVAILRHPVDRAYSEWGHQAMRFAEERAFLAFIREEPGVLAKSDYAPQLRRFPRALAENRLLVLVLEEALADPAATAARLGAFLGLDPAGFSIRPDERRNETYQPRFRRGFALARTVSDWLRARDLDGVANLAQRLGARRLFGHRGRLPAMTSVDRAALADFGARAIADTEALLGRPIPAWHAAPHAAVAARVAAGGAK
jgi:hypothetical protein